MKTFLLPFVVHVVVVVVAVAVVTQLLQLTATQYSKEEEYVVELCSCCGLQFFHATAKRFKDLHVSKSHFVAECHY